MNLHLLDQFKDKFPFPIVLENNADAAAAAAVGAASLILSDFSRLPMSNF